MSERSPKTDMILQADAGVLALRDSAYRDTLPAHPLPENSVVEVPDDGDALWILFGQQYSQVRVETQQLDSAPALPSREDWDAAVELSLRGISGLTVEELVDGEGIPAALGPGDFRVRILVSGRAQARLVDDPSAGLDAPASERLLVQTWKADPTPSEVLWDEPQQTLQEPAPTAAHLRAEDAARRIIHDITSFQGDGLLPSPTETLRLHQRIETPPGAKNLLQRLTRQAGWPWALGGGYWGDESDYPSKESISLSDPVTEIDCGEIWVHTTESTPTTYRCSWRLLRVINDGRDLQLLVAPSPLSLHVTEREPSGACTVLIEHTGLPTEWIDAFRAQWELILQEL